MVKKERASFDAFVAQCQELGRCYSTFLTLFPDDPQKLGVLNTVAKELFKDIQDGLHDLFYLRLGQVLDVSFFNEHPNVSFYRHYDILVDGGMPEASLSAIKSRVDALKSSTRTYRNKLVAHRDERTVLAGGEILNLESDVFQMGWRHCRILLNWALVTMI